MAIEDAARYRDALGCVLPPDLPEALSRPFADPLGDLVLRYARTHGPFTEHECALRFGIDSADVRGVLTRLVEGGRVVEGEFRPGRSGREWSGRDVLRRIRRRSLAKLRHEIEPVDTCALTRFLVEWHGLVRPRPGVEALIDAVEQLQGAPLAASIVEAEILSRRVRAYEPSDLDTLIASGDVVWMGLEPLGERDGRIALYLTATLPSLMRRPSTDPLDRRETLIVEHLKARGASFFAELHQASGGGYPAETVGAIWSLVWKGLLTNDTLQPLRTFVRRPEPRRRREADDAIAPRPRRLSPPSTEGRWSLVDSRASGNGFHHRAYDVASPRLVDPTRRAHARGGPRRRARRRLCHRLSGPQGDGRTRTHPSRVFRRRAGRHAVCAGTRTRASSLTSRSGRHAANGASGCDRSCQSAWSRRRRGRLHREPRPASRTRHAGPATSAPA